jgi:hypothetical protein
VNEYERPTPRTEDEMKASDTVTANRKGCFDTFLGLAVKGVLFGGLAGYGTDTKTLIFEDGRGFTFCSTGGYWVTSRADVERAVRKAQQELEATENRLREVLTLAGGPR